METLRRYDERYTSAVTSDPDNAIAVALFGEAATASLLQLAAGCPAAVVVEEEEP